MTREEHLPLQPPTFFILLSLASGEKHGYAILKDVELLSHGELHLGTGTLYGALSRLLEQGLIERVAEILPGKQLPGEGSHGPGRMRKAYGLTSAGRRVLDAEADRMQSLVRAAKQRLGEEMR